MAKNYPGVIAVLYFKAQTWRDTGGTMDTWWLWQVIACVIV